MVRLLSHLLGLLALLLAPLPAAANAPSPAALAISVAAEHCDEMGGSSHEGNDEPQEDAKHPCCKGNMSSCSPVAATFAGAESPDRAVGNDPMLRAPAETFVPGASAPPLTEPPTFA